MWTYSWFFASDIQCQINSSLEFNRLKTLKNTLDELYWNRNLIVLSKDPEKKNWKTLLNIWRS